MPRVTRVTLKFHLDGAEGTGKPPRLGARDADDLAPPVHGELAGADELPEVRPRHVACAGELRETPGSLQVAGHAAVRGSGAG